MQVISGGVARSLSILSSASRLSRSLSRRERKMSVCKGFLTSAYLSPRCFVGFFPQKSILTRTRGLSSFDEMVGVSIMAEKALQGRRVSPSRRCNVAEGFAVWRRRLAWRRQQAFLKAWRTHEQADEAACAQDVGEEDRWAEKRGNKL